MENRRKTGVFAWKTIALNVENTISMAYREHEKLQSLARLVFSGFQTKMESRIWSMEKLWIKIFCMWENMWKMLQTA